MKNKKLMILIIVILVIGATATAVGVSAAYWVGSDGTSTIAPQTDTTDWNYWSKYFIYEGVYEDGQLKSYRIVEFSGAVYEHVIIPRYATGGILRTTNPDGTYSYSATRITDVATPVSSFGNCVFANTTDKAVPTSITIPTTVEIEAGAFMGLTNLTTVKIVVVNATDGTPDKRAEIGAMAFFGCNNITTYIEDANLTSYRCGATDGGFDAVKSLMGLPADLTRSAS